MLRFTAILAVLLSFSIHLKGQNMHLTMLNESNGLNTNEVRHVIQDEYGFIWIATDDGLMRYDGTNVFNFSHLVPSTYGKFFANHSEGFYLSHDAGISLIRPGVKDAETTLVLEGGISKHEKALYYPNHLLGDTNNNLWISGAGGLVHNFSSNELQKINDANEDKLLLDNFAEVGTVVWKGSNRGELSYFDTGNNQFNKAHQLKGINSLIAHKGDLWVAGEHVYRIVLNEDKKGINSIQEYKSDVGEATAIVVDSLDNVYVGMKGQGLYFLDRYDESNPEFIKVYSNNDPHRVDEMPFKNIHNLVIADGNKIFVCSEQGLGILQHRFFESISSLPNSHAISIDHSGDKIYANLGELYVIEKHNNDYRSTPIPITTNHAITAVKSTDDYLWAGLSDGTLIKMDHQGKKLQNMDLTSRGEGIFYLNDDQSGRLWLCQAPREIPINGIGCILPDGRLIEYGPEKGLENRILCLKETNKGQIYATGIGISSYLYRYLPEDDAFINLSLPFDFYVSPNFEVHDLTVDSKGVFWLASSTGLLKYDMDRVRKIDLGKEFEEIEVRSVLDMPDGSIWISFDTDGLLRYHNGETILLKEESGLPSKVMSYRCLSRDTEGKLWIGTEEGLVYSLESNPYPEIGNPPFLTHILVDENEIPQDRLRAYSDQSIQFKFSAPAYHGYRSFYQYKLNEGDWSEANTNQSIILNELEAGSYTLSVRTKKEGGYLWSESTSIAFDLTKHWYEMNLWRWVAFIVVIALLTLHFQSRKMQFRRLIAKLTHGLEEARSKNGGIQQTTLASFEAEKDYTSTDQQSAIDQSQIQSEGQSSSGLSDLHNLEIVNRLISRINSDLKWDMVMELMSIEWMRYPNAVAFEIGTKDGKHLTMEGYSDQSKSYTSAHVTFNASTSLISYCISKSRVYLFQNVAKQSDSILAKRDKRTKGFKSAIVIPFYWGDKNAAFCLYSDKENAFNEYDLKCCSIFSSYLEQIL